MRSLPRPMPRRANWAETRRYWRFLPLVDKIGELIAAAAVVSLPFLLLFIAAACGIH